MKILPCWRPSMCDVQCEPAKSIAFGTPAAIPGASASNYATCPWVRNWPIGAVPLDCIDTAGIESATDQMLALGRGSPLGCRRGQCNGERVPAQSHECWMASNPGKEPLGASPMRGETGGLGAPYDLPAPHLAPCITVAAATS
jgi:hypothetical protein